MLCLSVYMMLHCKLLLAACSDVSGDKVIGLFADTTVLL